MHVKLKHMLTFTQKVITQSQPVFRYIADKCNLSGETADEKIKCDQTLAQVLSFNPLYDDDMVPA